MGVGGDGVFGRSAGGREAAWRALGEMVQALEERSRHFKGHSFHVVQLTRGLGEQLGWRRKALVTLCRAALVHDLGMMQVPDAVLNKRGNLTPPERVWIMDHPVVGARILAAAGLDRLALPVRHHHEWYDGRGYPDGLAGEAIPPGAAILAVAEAYDALTAERPYRRAGTPEAALAEIRACSGSQFDPRVVGALAECLPAIAARQPQRPAQRLGSAPLSRVVQHRWAVERELRVFERVARAVELVVDVTPLLNEVCNIVREELEVSMAVIRLLDPATGNLILGGVAGRQPMGRPRRFPAEQGILGWVASHREAVNVADVHLDPRAYEPFAELRSLAAVPMISRGGLVGVMGIGSDRPGVFTAEDLQLLEGVSHTIAATVAVAQLHQEVKLAATQDYLTGVANRREVLSQLEHRLARARREKRPLAVAMVDVNDLKQINDHRGHRAGDEAIRGVATALSEGVRSGDLVGRYGGDEFLVVLADLDRQQAQAVLDRVRPPSDLEFPLRWGCGVAAFPADGATLEELVMRADERLYRHKEAMKRGEG